MCELCDGVSLETVMARTRERIDAFGFTMMMVEGPTPWTYTIGLLDSFGHPELVVTSLEPRRSGALLTSVVNRVRLGQRFDRPGACLEVSASVLRFGPVHPAQWRHGRFAMWQSFYDWVGHAPDELAVQVLLPADDGVHHQLLDCDPGHNVHGLNRAERRRAARRRR